jgi:hypothetical protein
MLILKFITDPKEDLQGSLIDNKYEKKDEISFMFFFYDFYPE